MFYFSEYYGARGKVEIMVRIDAVSRFILVLVVSSKVQIVYVLECNIDYQLTKIIDKCRVIRR